MKMLKRICAMFLTVAIASSYVFSINVFAAEDARDGAKANFIEIMQNNFMIEEGMEAAISAFAEGTKNYVGSPFLFPTSIGDNTHSVPNSMNAAYYFTIVPSNAGDLEGKVAKNADGGIAEGSLEIENADFSNLRVPTAYEVYRPDYAKSSSSDTGSLGILKIYSENNEFHWVFLPIYCVFGLDMDGVGGHEWDRWYWDWDLTGSVLYCSTELTPSDRIAHAGDSLDPSESRNAGWISPIPQKGHEVNGMELLYYIAMLESWVKNNVLNSDNKYADYSKEVAAKTGCSETDIFLWSLSIGLWDDGYGFPDLGDLHNKEGKGCREVLVNARSLHYSFDDHYKIYGHLNYTAYNLGWACLYSAYWWNQINGYGNNNSTDKSGTFSIEGLDDVFDKACLTYADESGDMAKVSYWLLDTVFDKAAGGTWMSNIGNTDNDSTDTSNKSASACFTTDVLMCLRDYFCQNGNAKEVFGLPGSDITNVEKFAPTLYEKTDAAIVMLKYVEESLDKVGSDLQKRAEAAYNRPGSFLDHYNTFVEAAEEAKKKQSSGAGSEEDKPVVSKDELEAIIYLLQCCRVPADNDLNYGNQSDEVNNAYRNAGGTAPIEYNSISTFLQAVLKYLHNIDNDTEEKGLLVREYDATISMLKKFFKVEVASYYTEEDEDSPYNVSNIGGIYLVNGYLEGVKPVYEALCLKSDSNCTGLPTLELRCEIIDTCQKYNYDWTTDEFVTRVLADTERYYKYVHQDTATDGSADIHDLTHYGVFTCDRVGDYYAYQVMLSAEIFAYQYIMYPIIAASFVDGDGFTISQTDTAIQNISTLFRLHDRYKFIGYTNKLAVSQDATAPEIGTLLGLYDKLIEYGMLTASEYTDNIYDKDNPSTLFFTCSGERSMKFSYNYLEGRSLSATYIPMQTNTYDPYSILDYADLDWVKAFQYKYGFHRKALLIDTNPDAVMDHFVTKSQGATRVATLNDLLNFEKDIALYVDDNFYNVKDVAEKLDLAYDRITSEEQETTFFGSVAEAIGWVDYTDPARITKNAEFDEYCIEIGNNVSDLSYSHTVMDKVTNEDGTEEQVIKSNPNQKRYDAIILDYPAITKYLISATEYTPMMSYAFVSNIYRDKNVYNTVATNTTAITPVFLSSSQAGIVYNENADAFGTLMNYALLKNLPSMMTVGYETSSDMTSPIYVDIYGNIVTESGLVVIPAACNQTLHYNSGESMYLPVCSGFLSTYGQNWEIPIDWNVNEQWMSSFFVKNEGTGTWNIRNRTIAGVSMDFSRLSYSDKNINKAFKSWYQFDITNSSIIHGDNSFNVLHETLRGAPLECIDFDAENLNLNRTVDKSGLIAAAKLDSIINSLDWDTENSIMSIPSLSFIDNYQYVIVFVFKILLVIVVTALMITVYVDAMKSVISVKTVLKCLGVLLVGVSSVLILPVSYELSYYQSNKALLQDEAEYIMMLNTEKNMSGREIGVYQVTEPEQTTKVLLKLEDYKFDWISELPNVIFSDSIDVLDESYQEFLKSSPLINNEIVQVKNDGTYMDVQDIFDTSVLNFSTETKNLYQKVSVDPVASYYTPYYYFLDALLNNMNNYNSVHNIYAYSTKMMRGGQVKTVNLCSAYFNSPEFQDVYDDLLGLYQIYDVHDDIIYDDVFDNSVIEPAKSSQWYVGTFLKEEEVLKRLDLMTIKAQEFVVDNRDLIGKVTDETFLKCMAMSLAIDYNQLFGIPSADALEIYNLSNADLIRLTVADRDITLEDSPMSFARFVYNEAGTPGVYASVFLVITTMFVQTMKTVLTIGIFIILLVSVFVLKILLRKQNHSFAGYLLTLAVICGTNILYALILKVSLFIPTLGIPPTICIIIQVLIQLGYLFILGVVFMFALRDWRNGGFNYYSAIGGNIKNKAGKLFNRFRSTKHGRNGGSSGFSSDDRPKGVNGWKYLERLQKQQEKREKKAGR